MDVGLKSIPASHSLPARYQSMPGENTASVGLSLSTGSKKGLGINDFKIISTIRKSRSEQLLLAESRHSKKIYAIKVLEKIILIENDEIEIANKEKRILGLTTEENHPFIIRLYETFQNDTRLYFVTDFVPGGDLMWHIHKEAFTIEQARFYAAEVCLVLKFLHQKGIMHRDLKLDNIMMGLDGHIKVIGFGLCAEEMQYGSTTKTFCGNTEFMAPEVLLDKEYTFAVDWWAFGVITYQMNFQQQPFRGEDEDEIYDAILGEDPLTPLHSQPNTIEICRRLLAKAPEQRLGSGPTDAQEIMAHPYFSQIDWDDLYHKRLSAPFRPTISSERDTSNFEIIDTCGRSTDGSIPVQNVISDSVQAEFKNFSGYFLEI